MDQSSGIRYVVWIVAVAVSVGLAVAVSSLLDARPAIPVQPQTVDIKAGETLYTNDCASCHGVRLEGQKDWRKRVRTEGFLPPRMMKQGLPGTMVMDCCLTTQSMVAWLHLKCGDTKISRVVCQVSVKR